MKQSFLPSEWPKAGFGVQDTFFAIRIAELLVCECELLNSNNGDELDVLFSK